MIAFEVSHDMAQAMKAVQNLLATVRAKGDLLTLAGRRMTETEIPLIFRKGGPGWPPLGPPPMGRIGKPLQDVGRLRDSIQFRVTGDTVVIGTNAPGARIHNQGGTIYPSKKYLAIPLCPPLTISERRTKKPRDFSNTVVWIKGDPNRGYEGPGIYRPTARLGYSVKTHKPYHIFERIFALLKSVRIKQREFMRFDDSALQHIAQDWADAIAIKQVT